MGIRSNVFGDLEIHTFVDMQWEGTGTCAELPYDAPYK